MNSRLTKENTSDRFNKIYDEFSQMKILNVIANNLKEKMAQDGWSARSLGKVTGISDTTIRRILKGSQNISIDYLLIICIALEMELCEMLKRKVS